MMKQLFLTADEERQLRTAAPGLCADLKVTREDGVSHYEDADELKMRFSMASFPSEPEFSSILPALQAGKIPDIPFPKFTPAFEQEFYFTIGARGVAAIMQSFLPGVSTIDDLEALAAFSKTRHELLNMNTSTTPAA